MPEENETQVEENVQKPSEPVSQPEVTPISLTDAQLESLLESPALGNVVSEAVKRASQSDRDRATQKNATEIADLKSQGISEVLETFAALKEEGWNDKQAIRLMNSNLAQSEPEASAEPVLQGSDTQQPQLNYAQVFGDADIDANSPAAIQAAQKAGNDPVKLGIEIGLLQAQSQNQPAPSPAGVAQDGGQTSVANPTMDDLSSELDGLQARAMRGDASAQARKKEIVREMNLEEPMEYLEGTGLPPSQASPL